MNKSQLLQKAMFSLLLVVPAMGYAKTDPDQVLVSIMDDSITSKQLETVIRSSPFSTKFNTLGEDQQAALRGDLLKRMVASHLLRAEAEALSLDKSPQFKKELEVFSEGALYRFYMDRLKQSVKLSEDDLNNLYKKNKENEDSVEAAKSVLISKKYRALRKLTLQKLADNYHVHFYEDYINPKIKPDTLLMEGDKGLKISYGDIIDMQQIKQKPENDWIKDRLYQRAELLLISQAAKEQKIDVSNEVNNFRNERLPALLVQQKEKEWIPNDIVYKQYLEAHPEVGKVPARLHVGQIVLNTEKEAQNVLKRIKKGESLYTLAGELSIDPYGKAHNGDMGWVQQGKGYRLIEDAIKNLKDGEISDIIKTSKGYHIMTIQERRPATKRSYASMKDKIRQLIIGEKQKIYLRSLQKKYQVNWKLMKQASAKTVNSSSKTSIH